MFKRHLKVSLVKDDQKQLSTQDTHETAKAWMEAISSHTNKTGLKVMGGVLVYIAADTARKVLIVKAATK